MPDSKPLAPDAPLARHVDEADQPTLLWGQLADCIDAFGEAWDRAGEPPSLGAHLPASSAMLRRMALIELIKFDLERRWAFPPWRKYLEAYAVELPELSDGGCFPGDLIYEEFYIRKRHGEAVAPEEYCSRFPLQAAELQILLKSEGPGISAALHPPPRSEQFEPGQTIDDFDLLARLGKGAFATVFLARQRSLGRIVALKISANRGYETQTLAQLDHPNIVRVHDARSFPERGLQLMYMQYVSGGTLHAVVQRMRKTPPALRSGKLILDCIDEELQSRGETPPQDSRNRQYLSRLPWPAAVCWLGARLAGALQHAHAHGVLHRDLKPANVLLAADGSPKLADFNISNCNAVPGATAAAYFGGSLGYMSPEQLDICLVGDVERAASLDERSDLFSLGIMLWELLTGERPFAADREFDLSPTSLHEMAARRRRGLDQDMLSSLPDDCPPGVIDVLSASLEPRVEARIHSAATMRRQLDLCLQPEVQRMMRANGRAFVSSLRRHPLPLMLLGGMLPNLAASVPNIAYNLAEIVRQVQDPAVTQVFQTQIMTINPIAYALGIGIMIALAWPVLRSVKRREMQEPIAADELPACRRRALYLGDYVAWVSGIEWLVSGLVFPIWLRVSLGTSSGLDSRQYVHFFASQVVCGMLAATMSFFLVTIYSLRVLNPPLLDADRDDDAAWQSLEALAARTSVYTRLTFAVIPLALVVMPLVHTDSRWAFFMLGIVGLVAWALASVLARRIQRSIHSLQIAVNVEDLAASTESFESLRTLGRGTTGVRSETRWS
jgi:serine/threonine protein kinase